MSVYCRRNNGTVFQKVSRRSYLLFSRNVDQTFSSYLQIYCFDLMMTQIFLRKERKCIKCLYSFCRVKKDAMNHSIQYQKYLRTGKFRSYQCFTIHVPPIHELVSYIGFSSMIKRQIHDTKICRVTCLFMLCIFYNTLEGQQISTLIVRSPLLNNQIYFWIIIVWKFIFIFSSTNWS